MEMTQEEWDKHNHLIGKEGGLAQIISANQVVDQIQLECTKSIL